MKKLLIERKSKPSSSGNGNGGSGTSPAQAPAFKEDCFALEDVPILRGDRAELGTETPFGNNVIGFIGKAGVGKTTLAEIVAGCRPMSAPEGPRDGDLGSDPFGVTARCANGMVVLDSSSILSGILPPLKAPSPSLSLSLIYDMELVAFMLSVCNKIVVVQSQLYDTAVLECLSSAFLFMEGRCEHIPEIIFVLSRQSMELPITTEDDERLASKIQSALSPYYSGQTPKIFVVPDTDAEVVSTQSFTVSVEALYMELIKESSSSSKLPPGLHINTQKDWVKHAERVRSKIHGNATRLADSFQMKMK